MLSLIFTPPLHLIILYSPLFTHNNNTLTVKVNDDILLLKLFGFPNFKRLNSNVPKFLWKKNPAKISLKTLTVGLFLANKLKYQTLSKDIISSNIKHCLIAV